MVNQLRLVVTVDDYDEAVAFYRDVVGLREEGAFEAPNGGRGCILDAGRATLEIANAAQADYIDEVEVGRRGAGKYPGAVGGGDAAGGTPPPAAPGAGGGAPPPAPP